MPQYISHSNLSPETTKKGTLSGPNDRQAAHFNLFLLYINEQGASLVFALGAL